MTKHLQLLKEMLPRLKRVAYGFAVNEKYHHAAGVVARVLRGAKLGYIPLDYSTRFELVVNLKAAKTLGLSTPEAIVLRADDVIRRNPLNAQPMNQWTFRGFIRTSEIHPTYVSANSKLGACAA